MRSRSKPWFGTKGERTFPLEPGPSPFRDIALNLERHGHTAAAAQWWRLVDLAEGRAAQPRKAM